MTESEQFQKGVPSTSEKQFEEHENDEEESFSEHYFNDDVESDELDLESQYLKRLREQRKRIEDLSLYLEDSRQKYEEEAVKSKSLEMQLSKVRSQQISTTVYEQVTVELQMTVQENQELKESMEDLRRGLVDMATDSSAKLQRMSNEFSNQLRKDQSKIEALEDSLGEKEEEVERLQKAMKNKEKQVNDLNNTFNDKLNSVRSELEDKIVIQQKKVEKLEKETQKTDKIRQLQENLEYILRENEKLKEENFKLRKYIDEREKEFANQAEKQKLKVASLKKQLKTKEKQCEEARSNLTRIQRQKKDHSFENQDLKVQTIKLREELQTSILKKENDFYIERRNMKMTIDQHTKTIEDLFKIKEQLMGRIKQLQAILRRKETIEKQRRSMLKDEMKEIDKLEKVIDRIVE